MKCRMTFSTVFQNCLCPAAPGKEDASRADGDNDRPRFPHASKFKEKFKFERSGEPTAENEKEADEPNPYLDADDHWTQQDRPPWQQHSALGPNVNPEGRLVHFSPLEAVVDPEDHNYLEGATQRSRVGCGQAEVAACLPLRSVGICVHI